MLYCFRDSPVSSRQKKSGRDLFRQGGSVDVAPHDARYVLLLPAHDLGDDALGHARGVEPGRRCTAQVMEMQISLVRGHWSKPSSSASEYERERSAERHRSGRWPRAALGSYSWPPSRRPVWEARSTAWAASVQTTSDRSPLYNRLTPSQVARNPAERIDGIGQHAGENLVVAPLPDHRPHLLRAIELRDLQVAEIMSSAVGRPAR